MCCDSWGHKESDTELNWVVVGVKHVLSEGGQVVEASQVALVVKNPPPSESTCQCRRQKRSGLDPWIRKIPWRRARQPIPVFLPAESHGQREPGRLQSTGLQRIRHN